MISSDVLDEKAFSVNEEDLRLEETRYLLKSPSFAGFLSALVMGLGQAYNGQIRKAVTLLAAQGAVILYLWDYLYGGLVGPTLAAVVSPPVYTAFMVVLVVGGVAFWLFNVRDAYQTAQFCQMIFDRTVPVLDDEEEEFIQAHLTVGRGGLRVHRAFSQKAVYAAGALGLYSLVLVMVTARYMAHGEEIELQARLAAAPADHGARLRLAELLVARRQLDAGRRELAAVVSGTDPARDPRTASVARMALARLASESPLAADRVKAGPLLLEARALLEGAQGRSPGESSAAAPASPLDGAPAGTGALLVGPGGRAATGPAGAAVDSGPPPNAPGSPPPAVPTRETAPPMRVRLAPPADLPAASPAQEWTGAGAPGPAPILGQPPERLLARAEANLKVKNYTEVRRLLASYARTGTPTATYHALKGRTAAETGRWQEAVDHLRRAEELGHPDPDLPLLRADALLKVGQEREAQALLEAYLRDHPHRTQAVLSMAALHRRAGRPETAQRLVEEALVDRPEDALLLSLDYDLSLERGNDERAYQVALTILRSHSSDTGLIRSLVEKALAADLRPLAARVAVSYLKPSPDEPHVYFVRSLVHARVGRMAEAAADLERAMRLGMEDLELFVKLAQAHRAAGALSRAQKAVERGLELHPAVASMWRELGALKAARGDATGARRAYRHALTIDPADAHAQKGLGDLERLVASREGARASEEPVADGDKRPADGTEAAGRPAGEAQAKGTRVRTPAPAPPAEPSAAPSRAVRAPTAPEAPPAKVAGLAQRLSAQDLARIAIEADAEYRARHYGRAADLFRQIIEADPLDYRSRVMAGMSMRALKRHDQALAHLQQARLLNPRDPEIVFELGQTYTDKGDTARAVEELEELIRREPHHLAGRYLLGVNYERSRRYARAEEQYRTIMRQHPDLVDVHDYLGNLFFSQRRFHEASAEYQRVADARPSDPAARFKLAVTLVQQRSQRRARRELLTLKAALSPSDPLYPRVIDYLSRVSSGG